MSYNYTDCLEIACIDRFKCELNDLCVLEDIYTDLAEQSNVDYEKLARMNNLHTMVEYTYKTIRDCIANCIKGMADTDKYIKVIPDNVDDYVKYEINNKVKEDMRKLAEEIKKAKPVHEDLSDVMFNSIIDEAIEVGTEGFEDYPEHVAERVIQLAYDKGLIKVNKKYKE